MISGSKATVTPYLTTDPLFDDPTDDVRTIGSLGDGESVSVYFYVDYSEAIDQVVTTSGLPVHRVLSTISVLEMRRLVRRLSGQVVQRI